MLREPPGHPDVEDAANETLRRAIERPDSLRDSRALRAWVLGIARHVALDVIRARKRARAHDELVEEPGSQRTGVELADGGPDPYERVAEARRAEMVKKAFEQLPEGQRKALMMFHLEGLEYQEIAARLEVPLGTIATWVSRGRKAMATTLEEARDG
jgi:RNA polymerase sigma-70 factor (ECF subfamily)